MNKSDSRDFNVPEVKEDWEEYWEDLQETAPRRNNYLGIWNIYIGILVILLCLYNLELIGNIIPLVVATGLLVVIGITVKLQDKNMREVREWDRLYQRYVKEIRGKRVGEDTFLNVETVIGTNKAYVAFLYNGRVEEHYVNVVLKDEDERYIKVYWESDGEVALWEKVTGKVHREGGGIRKVEYYMNEECFKEQMREVYKGEK